jgi:transcriptional regulator with XRE-family HTH domain
VCVLLSLVENVRRKQLNWVKAVMAARTWNASQLAAAAGIDHSTLSKFLNDTTNTAQLSTRSVEGIAEAGGIPPYMANPPSQPRGFAEQEAAPYIHTMDDPLADAISAITKGKNGIDPWVMRSRALENGGYLPGDLLIVDLNSQAHDGDVVCVQIYDRNGKAETAFRIFEKPYLVAASSDPALRRPILLDGDRAIIRGVVVASLRPRTPQNTTPEAA